MYFGSINKLITLGSRIIDPRRKTEPVFEFKPQKPHFEIKRAAEPLKRAKPEEMGVPSALVSELLSKMFDSSELNLHSVMIIRDGTVICEAAVGGYDFSFRRLTFSECKSIVSLAIGCLLDEGRISLDTKVIDIFKNIAQPVSKLKLKKLTVKDLLTMTSTIEFAEVDSLVEDEWKKCFLLSSTKGEIGETFNYNSINTYMLAAIVNEVTNMTLTEYLKPRLFDPLGIEDYYWEKSAEGIEKGGWGLYMLTEDVAKIAILVMNKGVWKEKRIISEWYISEAVKGHAKTPSSTGPFNYGYQIWTGKDTDTFLFNGMFGQNALGFLRNKIIVLTNGGNNEMFQTCPYYGYIIEAFDRDFNSRSKPDPRAYNELLKNISRIKGERKKSVLSLFKGEKLPLECALLDGKSYESAEPDAASCGLMPMLMQIVLGMYTSGLKGVSFSKENNRFYMTYTEHKNEHKLAIGFDKPGISELVMDGEYYYVAAKGRFTRDEDDRPVLVIRVDFPEMPSTRYIKFFYGDKPLLCQSELPGGEYLAKLIIGAKKDIEQIPAIGGAASKIDDEYLRYKIDRVFSPEIDMKSVY